MTNPEVNTRCGQLRGSKQKGIDDFDFFAFKGIPYAKPPIGELRFHDPIPAEPWNGTRDALHFGPMSAQYDTYSKKYIGSDDCLYLNVYTKNIEPNKCQPVMVYIHGGGYLNGSGNDFLYGPDYLMRKDVVLVTINYRLGILGFLNLEDEIAPGNQGFKDQVMSLKWVRDNIANFGGDPDNVTIFGESAGATSVHYLTLSPLAKGLFHRAISQSGVATCPWASVSDDHPIIHAYKLCSLLGKEIKDPTEIVTFLKTVDVLKLVEVQKTVKLGFKNPRNLPFGPGVDDKSAEPFLPVPLDVAVKQGAHVPYLLGHNDREGTCLLHLLKFEDYEKRNLDFENDIHPRTMKILEKNNLSLDDLRYMYFKNEEICKENCDKSIDLIGDTYVLQAIHNVIRIQVECNSAPTYMYQFTYDKGYRFPKLMFNDDTPGASHMDDLFYLFGMKFFHIMKLKPLEKGTAGYRVMEQMVEMWTNFARLGRPTPVTSDLVPLYWEPVVNGSILRHMNIGEKLYMDKMLNINERFNCKKYTKSIRKL